MKRILLAAALLAVVAALVVGLLAPADDALRVTAGARAPSFEAVTLDGSAESRTLANYEDHVVLVNVWATWCPPCLEEMPTLERLWRAYGDRGLRVVAISIDDPGAEDLIREFVADHDLTFDVLHDPTTLIMDQYQVQGVPQSFLIDRNGVIRLTLFATDWFAAEQRAAVEALLADGPP